VAVIWCSLEYAQNIFTAANGVKAFTTANAVKAVKAFGISYNSQ
jgi:hypothetical protein